MLHTAQLTCAFVFPHIAKSMFSHDTAKNDLLAISRETFIWGFQTNGWAGARLDMSLIRPTKKYFCFPLPYPVSPLWVGPSEILFFLTSKIPYPLNLIVNIPNIGNETKYTQTMLTKKNLFKDIKHCLHLTILSVCNEILKKKS